MTSRKKHNQYKTQAQTEAVLYVPHTRGSILKKEVQKREDSLLKGRLSGRIKVMERLGPTMRNLLANPNPWKGKHCGRQGCPPCATKEGSCRHSNIVYTISCVTCAVEGRRRVYHGESHRTLYERTVEHWEGLRDQTEDSVLWRHWREEHSDRETAPDYSVKVAEKCRSSTERQIKESLIIESEESTNLINNKSEWGQNPVPRQATEFGDRPWEDRREGDNNRSETQRRETREKHRETDPFSSQYSQRRKALREEKKRLELAMAAGETEDQRDTSGRRQGQGRAEGFQLAMNGQQPPGKKRKRTGDELETRRNPSDGPIQRNLRDMFRRSEGTSDLVPKEK